jgi:ATP synthase protein I
VKQDSPTKQVSSAVSDGWIRGGSFLESILAGMLLGYLLDRWLGTEPWLVIAGVIIGSYAGFVRVWAQLKDQDS